MTAGDHLVQFYDTDAELLAAVAPYLAAGLNSDESVLVVATDRHLEAFTRELEAMHTGVHRALAAGTYIAIDAEKILSVLHHDAGEIDAARFDESVGKLVRELLATGRPLRVYGEIVALLWQRDDAAGAVALEAIWNGLQQEQPFTLFCGYPVIEERLEAVKEVCCLHSLVLPAIADPHLQPADSAVSAEFMPTIEAPGRARVLLRTALRELQLGEDVIERLTLTASELAANAVLHARTPFRLLVQPRRDSVWIAVEDHDPLGDPLDVAGRPPHGLGLIAALALRWGVAPKPTGKLVWAQIPR